MNAHWEQGIRELPAEKAGTENFNSGTAKFVRQPENRRNDRMRASRPATVPAAPRQAHGPTPTCDCSVRRADKPPTSV